MLFASTNVNFAQDDTRMEKRFTGHTALEHSGSFDCVAVRFANVNFAQDDTEAWIYSQEWEGAGTPPGSEPSHSCCCLSYFREASSVSSVAGTFWARISASALVSGSP